MEQAEWIKQASYEDLLRKWRFAKAGDPMFFGKDGADFAREMQRKKLLLQEHEQVAISKKVGWTTGLLRS